ncbi:transcriptional regulator [Agromyces sp. SYSU K20354]|uniref:ArsR family transcriptional regulator n=1 Tax=Agromyces cavernae TaxID=2898659 RepID=UPI001E2F1ED1|nr:ArsR family transcriptional regulator [Agromyces cavernae]MCD2443185.1 transcriptional regulator [Agromyces cavernae]
MDRVTADRAIDLLIASGVDVDVQGASRVDLLRDGRRSVEMKVRQTPATPSQIARDLRQTEGGQLLYVVPRMTPTLRSAAAERDLAVVAVDDGVALIDGQEFRPSAAVATTPTLPKSSRRTPWGRFAVMRALCRTREPRTQAQLADEVGITQAAVSQSVSKLNDLVARGSSGWSVVNVRPLAARFLADYPGAGGIGVNWFALDPVNAQAETALNAGLAENAILSGDVGADRIAPWRVPAKAIIYAAAGLDLAKAGFAHTTAERATLELRVPADPTLWPTANAYAGGQRPSTADPLIVAHDILRTGGSDADEAVEHVVKQLAREWGAR